MAEEAKAPKRGKKVRVREKKQRTGKKHRPLQVWKYYSVKGDSLERSHESCPRCGEGTWLAKHGNRSYCGKCGYTIFASTTAEPAKPAPAPEPKPPNEKPEPSEPKTAE